MRACVLASLRAVLLDYSSEPGMVHRPLFSALGRQRQMAL